MFPSTSHVNRFFRLTSLSPARVSRHLVHKWTQRLSPLPPNAQEDPTISYNLHTAFSKDPNTVKAEDAFDDYTQIHLAAIRAGKRPPRKKRPQFDAVGNQIGTRHINRTIPLRLRKRLIAEGTKMDPQFFVGRYGLNSVLVKRIRSAFRYYEMVRIEIGSPWLDNTEKFSERIELRTGATVLDRAGSRLLLYRGFTHADLARKGLTDPACFTVGVTTSLRHRARTNHSQYPTRRQHDGRSSDQPRQSGTLTTDQVQQQQNQSEAANAAPERLEGEAGDQSTYIDLDDDAETLVGDEEEEVMDIEDEPMDDLISSIQYRAAKLKGRRHGVDPELFTGPEFEDCV